MSLAALDGLPRVALRAPASDPVAVLRRLQGVLLAHPIAAQAAFSALLAEGRRFATTPAGRRWQEQLVRSPLLRRVRAPFDAATLWMLDEGTPDVLPSGYVDALCAIARSEDVEGAVGRLLEEFLRGADDGAP